MNSALVATISGMQKNVLFITTRNCTNNTLLQTTSRKSLRKQKTLLDKSLLLLLVYLPCTLSLSLSLSLSTLFNSLYLIVSDFFRYLLLLASNGSKCIYTFQSFKFVHQRLEKTKDIFY